MLEGVHPAVIVTSVVGGAFMLAMVAVALSQKATTANVIGQAGSALSGIITAAVSPVTGGGTSIGGGGSYTGNAVSSAGQGSTLTL